MKLIYTLALTIGGIAALLSRLWWVVLIAAFFYPLLIIPAFMLLGVNLILPSHTTLDKKYGRLYSERDGEISGYAPKGWRD